MGTLTCPCHEKVEVAQLSHVSARRELLSWRKYNKVLLPLTCLVKKRAITLLFLMK